MRQRIATIILLLVGVGAILFLRVVEINTKALLLISQEFPQIPFKPLHLLTPKPEAEQVELTAGEQKITADIFYPSENGRYPALILAMGVRTNEQDKPVILGFADTLARLGYVVTWPHSQNLDEDKIGFESPETFRAAFNYLSREAGSRSAGKTRPDVDSQRISFVGFSVGSSLAMVAAEDSSISKDVHGFVFFGGYYNIFDYLKALATPGIWQPHEGATSHAKKVLGFEGLTLDNFEDSRLAKFSPDTNIRNFDSRLFILHDKSDSYVPWTESEKLRDAVCSRVICTYHLSSLLEHAQASKQTFSWGLVGEFWKMYLFLYQVFDYL